MILKIQEKDFIIEDQINYVKSKHLNVGAVSTFVGYVRNFNDKKKVNSITIEVYKEMALKAIEKICSKAKKKWNIIDILIINRYGKLKIADKIVLVSTFAAHRKDSFDACNFIMDYLKKDAPFWKKEFYNDGFNWLKNKN